MILDELLGPLPTADFLDRYYLRHPFARPGGCRWLVAGLGWPLVDSVLAEPGVDALAVRGAEVWPGGAPDPAHARDLFAAGHTIRVRHAERHDPALARLADGFGRALAAPVDVHLYATPAGCPGLGWHYDAEEVFVLHLAGSKEWSVRKNTVNPWPLPETIPADQKVEREITPQMVCDLHLGDWLYVPGGYWHRTRAGAEASLSLSVGVMAATAVDAFDWLRGELLADLRWRQRLPVAGEVAAADPEELAGRYREVFADLGRDLADRLARQETARAFLTVRQCPGDQASSHR